MDNRTANKIINTRKVGLLRIRYIREPARGGKWCIYGSCVSTGHPDASWIVGQDYLLGEGETLADAAKTALIVPALQAA